MITETEIHEILDTTDTADQTKNKWVIKLRGKTFRNRYGRSVWDTKGKAMNALYSALNYKAHNKVYRRLSRTGTTVSYWQNTEYLNAWDNMKTYMLDEGILEFKQLKR